MAVAPEERIARDVGSLTVEDLVKRINIPLTATSPPGLVEANSVDPWSKSGKYALGWTYFCLVLLMLVAITRVYHKWTDKLRQAMHKNEVEKFQMEQFERFHEDVEWDMAPTATAVTERVFFPENTGVEKQSQHILTRGQSHWSSIAFVNDTLALFRWIFYRPIPEITYKKKKLLGFPSLAVVAIIIIALTFTTLYCFLPQPLYWQSIQYGSPPLAIRSGMMAVAMTPWIVATSMKANIITYITGIGHDRLGVFHRWSSYLCLFLVLVHTIPFYVQPVWKDGGMAVFGKLFPPGNGIIYGSGIACLVPFCWLCIASLPFIRSIAYELFVVLHVPVAIAYVGLMFWHAKNYLNSWAYLWTTVAIWVVCYFIRLFNLNWSKPWRNSWLIGDEAAVTLMAENAIKVTVPTQMSWKPGQYVYLRMPAISIFENHPFTISSLCSEDFPSEYGELYRDCTMVFRPFGGFTRKVLETAIEKGPFHTYRAYLEGPYGGMQRELAAFETVILFAGGSGITAIVSQLLDLIKRMRDGKAVTKKIEVVWALRKLEAMDWFKEELRICRESAPPGTVTCQFYVTKAKRGERSAMTERAPRPISQMFHDKLDGFVTGIASKRNSAYIRDEAQGDEEYERQLREENQDAITSLPQQKYLQPRKIPPQVNMSFPPPPISEASRRDTLKKLEGKQKRKSLISMLSSDSHEASRKFLSPLSVSRRDDKFHFPAPKKSPDGPHFQFAPRPSPWNRVQAGDFPMPPPQAYRPETYRPTSYTPQSDDDRERPYSFAASSEAAPTPPIKDFDIDDKSSYPPPPPGGPPRTSLPPPPPLPINSTRSSVEKPQRSPDLKLDIPSGGSIPRKSSHNGNDYTCDPASNPEGFPFPNAPPASNTYPQPQQQQYPQYYQSQEPPSPRPTGDFEFGFPETPTEFQKSLMRFAFLGGNSKKSGWSTEYGRPDLGYILKEMATGGLDGKGIFGKRTCVFVCGPPTMRVSVANSVARLQADIWGDESKDEIFLHTENYAI